MPISAPKFNGRLKREIADEAFRKLGKYASIDQVDAYFKKYYGISHCERSMFSRARANAQGRPGPVRRRYRNCEQRDMAGIIARIRELAKDVGSYGELADIIRTISETKNRAGGYYKLLDIIAALTEGT